MAVARCSLQNPSPQRVARRAETDSKEVRPMDADPPTPLKVNDENAALRMILEGTATTIGEHFFRALVKNLALALNTQSAWVTTFDAPRRQLQSLALWANGSMRKNIVIDIDDTPCEKVIKSTELVHYPDNLAQIYPAASTADFKPRSYLGVPLLDSHRQVIGNLAVMDSRPMPCESRAQAIIRIFAARASAELQRLRAEATLRRSEEKYRRIIETTGEGFLLMDKQSIIIDANQAFCRLVGLKRDEVLGRKPEDFASEEFQLFLSANQKALSSGRIKQFEGTVVAKNGRKIPVRIHGDLLRDDQDGILGHMSFVSDMTQQKKSMALAAEVQRTLLPQSGMTLNGFDIAGRTLSCDEIGGDYFDFLQQPSCDGQRMGVVVGDVVGHGVDAALLMTSARAALRMQMTRCADAVTLVSELNRQLVRDVIDSGRFMTLFYMEIDPQRHHLKWVRAGHPPALLYDPATDRFRDLKGQGIALGIQDAYTYRASPVTDLRKGQVIAIGTDGIWEADNPLGEVYGRERYCQVIRQNAQHSAEAIVQAIYDDMGRFSKGLEQKDDITLVIIKVERDPKSENDWQI
jgi:PAS domain S-box-containing protein